MNLDLAKLKEAIADVNREAPGAAQDESSPVNALATDQINEEVLQVA